MTSVWRTLIRSIGIDPSLFDLVCDFMEYILERFPSRAITKRVSQTARAIIQASHSDSELISVLVDRPFFTTLIDHLDTALSGPADDFPPDLFHLLLDLVSLMPPGDALSLFHHIGREILLHILIHAQEKAAFACLSLLTFLCLRDREIAATFEDVASVLSLNWKCDSPNCSVDRKIRWIQFCHALLFQLPSVAAPHFTSLRVVEVASSFLDEGAVEFPLEPLSEYQADCLHLISLMLQACENDPALLQLVIIASESAIDEIIRIAEMTDPSVAEMADPSVAEMADPSTPVRSGDERFRNHNRACPIDLGQQARIILMRMGFELTSAPLEVFIDDTN
jgi:hypothetical protein